MRRFLSLVAAASLALVPGQAESQTFGATGRVQLTGVGSGVVSSWDNVYIGGYDGVLVSDPSRPALTLYCVDFAHSVSVGDTWNVNVSGIGAGADLSNTRLSGDDPTSSLVRYRKAAFLASLFESNAGRSNYSGIHAAIWRTMTPGFPGAIGGVNDPALAMTLAQPWLDMAEAEAQAGFANVNLAEWRILSDVRGDGHVGGRQEFLTRATVTPEPSTWALMITGLLLLGFFARRRLRELDEVA